jgi:hypothetical protein
MGLPNRCVLWEVYVEERIYVPGLSSARGLVSLALSDKLPAGVVEFAALEQLLIGTDEVQDSNKVIRTGMHLVNMRQPVLAQGRRVVLKYRSEVAQTITFSVGLVFSSIPKDIPDFYAGSPGDQWDELIRLMRIGVRIR